MKQVNALVLRAAGINCDYETQYALELAGANAQRMHINELIKKPEILESMQILVFPGGFSYGDDIAAGKILANQVQHHLGDIVRKFIDDGKLVLGICNGFQVLVKTGILPGLAGADNKTQTVTITNNDSAKFDDRWVYLQPSSSSKCVFINKDQRIYLPMAHGEGKVVTKTPEILESIKSNGHIALRYVDENGNTGDFPINPNGSMESIAGLTDSTGRVLGLMPHPERFVRKTQHPRWTRLGGEISVDGMIIFNNAVKYVEENL